VQISKEQVPILFMKNSLFILLILFISTPSFAAISSSDTQKIMSYMTDVKSQKSRGTCTIFSTTALLEALLIKKGLASKDIDLSEEWLEYLAMSNQNDEGSTVNRNIKKLRFFGMTTEKKWPYIGEKWTSLDSSPLAKSRCGTLSGDKLLSCLWGHQNPELLRAEDNYVLSIDEDFYHIREDAKAFMNDMNLRKRITKAKSYQIEMSQAKKLLLKGIPVIAGMKLYYGSWNHSKTDKFEIQKRDKSLWYKGIVGFPEVGSKDRRICDERGGGHSVVIVGFDDNKTITSRLLMDDGTWKSTTYKGVYYFKNSWGVKGFGRDFEFNGESMPGYGMITQKYLNDLGRFYHLPLK
jgi:hypothetical protein